jgi:hypothetical protein
MRLSEAANEEHGRYRTEVNVVEIAAGRPTVPDAGAEIGVVVVLTVGTRTAWELVGIAEACADAGHEVVGVVLTRPVRLSEEKTDKPVKGGPSRIPEDRDAMAGSA